MLLNVLDDSIHSGQCHVIKVQSFARQQADLENFIAATSEKVFLFFPRVYSAACHVQGICLKQKSFAARFSDINSHVCTVCKIDDYCTGLEIVELLEIIIVP